VTGQSTSPPTTQIDARFSAPNAVATTWVATRRVLEGAELFWISSVRADGRPHVTPLVAVWLDGAVHFCTGAGEQKAHNLRANPQVTLTTGCNRWQDGIDVVVEGEAVRVNDDTALDRLAQAWAQKWDGRWQWEVRDGAFHEGEGEGALVYSVTPTKVLAFSKDPFGHTRHLF
jgi:nitroimidazol reductase NimA-like FMN-containing flavoprotein (pyridoxamine 5'-phosphate oxidase superfamily)